MYQTQYQSALCKELEHLAEYPSEILLFNDSSIEQYSSPPDLATSIATSVNSCTPSPVTAKISPCFTERECLEPAESKTLGNSSISKRHISPNKAERKAEHNAIERARRECLNSKFQQLADALPNLQAYRRPSKGQIVEKALDWVKQNQTKEEKYQQQISQLQNENKCLSARIIMMKQHQSTTAIPTFSISTPTTYFTNTRQVLSDRNMLTFNNHKDPAINSDGALDKERYQDIEKEANITFSNVTVNDWKKTGLAAYEEDIQDYALSLKIGEIQEEGDNESKSSLDEYQDSNINGVYPELATYDLNGFNINTFSSWEKNQQNTLYSHPSINSVNSGYYHHPYSL
ncbi:hypothetical protein G6F62_010747 [Rhizopus arrhizus]|nr:hypothetical protein G6F23_011002 [Rhizopus arrhizus]KAG0781502.1 hypothetical protein G6F22_009539 [Rhizopus arrhizus]KAG0782455.1 hypothetical protein G6F21_011105 [Rhizopus arrhizus]KAG0806166.1 hypothetical protein G6F20_011342 [Rhizopus arrhizus]KAG0822386.1 hypothetical protein G6F19_011406 [Rhizopus arrhizus]